MHALTIRQAAGAADVATAARLFREYAEGLGISLCFQGFDSEVATLPGTYAPPSGRLLLAEDERGPAGCIALRDLSGGRCEMKRLYVRPEARGGGAGKQLVRRLLAEAAACGYARMLLDSLPGVMDAALALYLRLGFTDIAPYYDNPNPGVRYLQLPLPRVTFRPLAADDMPLLHRWLNQPHMRAHYQPREVSLAEVSAKYGPRLAPDSVCACHVALVDGRPAGKLQCYRNVDHRAYADAIGATDGVSVDLFLGDPALTGRGVGAAMLRRYVGEVVFARWPGERRCTIAHAESNPRAIACSRAAGFRPVRAVLDDGVPSQLFELDRADLIPTPEDLHP